MSKIVNDGNVVPCTDNFQSAMGAEETFQRLCGVKFVNSQQGTGGNGGQCVGDVKTSDEVQRETFAVH